MHKHRLLRAVLLSVVLLMTGCGEVVLLDPSGIKDLREAKAGGSAVISVDGRVADEDGAPLKDITVVITGHFETSPDHPYYNRTQPLDTLITNGLGEYKMESKYISPAYNRLQIDASDPRGIYRADSIFVQTSTTSKNTTAPTIYLKKK